MYKRLRDSFFSPKKTIEYRKDKLWFVLLYMFILILLSGAGEIIQAIQFDGIPVSIADSISDNSEYYDTTCEIQNSNLVCQNDKTEYIEFDTGFTYIQLILNPKDEEITLDGSYLLSAEVHDDELRVYYFTQLIDTYAISNLPEEWHNLSLVDINPSSAVFWNDLFAGIDELLISFHLIIAILMIFSTVIYNTFLFLIVVLMNFILIKLRLKKIKSKELFVILAYSSSGIMIINFFNGLFYFSSTVYLILLFLAFVPILRVQNEITRRVAIGEKIRSQYNEKNIGEIIKDIEKKKKDKKKAEEDNDDIDKK